MITNYDIYKRILRVLRKEQRGRVVTEDEFNAYLIEEGIAFFDVAMSGYESVQDVSDKLDPFKETALGTTMHDVNNKFNIPADYAHYDAVRYMLNGTTPRGVDVVTNAQLAIRRGSSLFVPTERNPVCIVRNKVLELYPETANPNYLTLYYLRYPIEPILDGYFDSEDNFVYLSEGESHTLTTGEVALDGTTGTTYTSKTVEMEWDEESKLKIADRILARLGVSLNDAGITQHAMAVEKES